MNVPPHIGSAYRWSKKMASNKKKTPDKNLKVNEKKWSKTLMAPGWTVIPNIIIERQAVLGLDATDINILMHLAMYWWTAESKPHPSKVTIAKAMGVTPRTIQRRIKAMEAHGLIERKERRIKGQGSRTNIYDLSGLIKAAKPYAEERLQEIEAKEAAKRVRAGRKGKPRLKVVASKDD